MKIVQLEISNFKNIGHATYNFETNPVIFSGENGIGKSNTLNALMWMITGMLLTDKYGDGENDLDKIVPNNYEKGMHTEVSITFENGTKFTKVYKTRFSRKSGKANGHTTDLLVNGVIQNKVEDFKNLLYECFDFKEVFKAPEVKEINLFVDPLYALQKLKPELLRGLLAKLGCEISNEEVFDCGFEDLKPYESKYIGKFDSMKKDLNNQNTKIKNQVKDIKSKIETVKEVEEFTMDKTNSLNAAKEKLILQKNSLIGTDHTLAIQDIDYQIKEQELLKETAIQKEIASINAQLKLLDDKSRIENQKLAMAAKSKTEEFKNKVSSLELEISIIKSNLVSLDNKIADYRNKIKNYSLEAKDLTQRKSDMAIKLNVAIGKTYSNYFTCPNCGESFPASEDDLKRFEYEKRVEVEDLQNNIRECTSKIASLKDQCFAYDKDLSKLEAEKSEFNASLLGYEKELLAAKNALETAEKVPLNTSGLEAVKKEYEELVTKKNQVPNNYVIYDQKILELKNEKERVLGHNREHIQSEILAIEGELANIETDLAAEYVKQSDWAKKVAWQKELDVNIKQLNDNEFLLGRVTDFINTMISKLNKKATEKIGIEFVMLEENLTNENLNPVCYALINGVEFQSVNTAKKLEVGIKFIERLKEIAVEEFEVSKNSLPILADKLEGFDHLEKVKNLTNEQLIGTRVSSEKVITIL